MQHDNSDAAKEKKKRSFTLLENSCEWEFVAVDGQTFPDAGTAAVDRPA
jgi:hypothetical protein